MKTIKILLHTRTCFIFSRNVTTFFSASNFNINKLRKSHCRMTALHRVRREDKFMYGPMIKKERQTLKESAGSLQSKEALMDSELWWNLKLAKHMTKAQSRAKPILIAKVKKIKIHKKLGTSNDLPDRKKNKIIVNTKQNIVKSEIIKDVKEVQVIGEKQDTKNKYDDALKMKDIASESNSSSSKDIKLLDVVINNITSFPIFNVKKKLPIVTDKVKILSISAKDEPETLHYPSVTKILSATLSEQSVKALELWKAKLIAKMGVDKFNEYYQEQLKNGTLFHSCIENTLYGKNVDVPDHIQPAFNSLSDIVKGLKDIRAIESHVSHKHLHYKGKIDCVAVYRGELCAIDWKKSEKDKTSLILTYDAPVQIAAYVGALNYSNSYPFTISSGLIVVGYTNGKPADTYIIKDSVLKTYWKKWLTKVQRYWTSISKQN